MVSTDLCGTAVLVTLKTGLYTHYQMDGVHNNVDYIDFNYMGMLSHFCKSSV